jgi:hypothetical protein
MRCADSRSRPNREQQRWESALEARSQTIGAATRSCDYDPFTNIESEMPMNRRQSLHANCHPMLACIADNDNFASLTMIAIYASHIPTCCCHSSRWYIVGGPASKRHHKHPHIPENPHMPLGHYASFG